MDSSFDRSRNQYLYIHITIIYGLKGHKKVCTYNVKNTSSVVSPEVAENLNTIFQYSVSRFFLFL